MSLESEIDDWAESAKKQLATDVQTLVRSTHVKIVTATPIDTGRARSSWNIAAGFVADESVTPLLVNQLNTGGQIRVGGQRAPGASPLTAAQSFTAAFGQHQNLVGDGVTFTISNNLDYIWFLELGGSQQAPSAGQMFQTNVDSAYFMAEQMGYLVNRTVSHGVVNPF